MEVEIILPYLYRGLGNALFSGRVKSTRSSYLKNRLTFENQTWYTIKKVTLEHFDTIFKLIFFHMYTYNKGIIMAGYRKNGKIGTGQKWMNFYLFKSFFLTMLFLKDKMH